ncbi:MAG: hypothetical protein K6B41_02150, partial [Butyrivibrio sp.]|nr:hypothetical protein [Butyrivibrio sp.]
MNSKQRKHYRIGLVLLFILEIIFVIAHALYIYSYNKSVHKITGESKNKEISVDIHARGDETSSWIIRDLDLNGIIYDVEIKNESESELYSWTLRMNIKQDCYINQFWNGEVEIHQYVGSKDEVVQRLNLAKYSKDELKVDYMINDTDLLIPLKKGDYIIYHPSIVIKEQPISIDDSVVVGVILYYKDSLDLTDYEMDYTSHKEFTEGIGFFVICILIVAWLFLCAMYFSIIIIYKSAEKEMELRKAGISCMADLYEIIYIIDITEDTLTPVGVSEENDEARPKDLGANAQLKNMFDYDSTEEYKDLMIVFADLETLPRRLEKRDSIAIEYLSKYHGWCRIRYFAMDREEGKPVDKVIFTVQTINEE